MLIPLSARMCGRAKSFAFGFESSLAFEKKTLSLGAMRSRNVFNVREN